MLPPIRGTHAAPRATAGRRAGPGGFSLPSSGGAEAPEAMMTAAVTTPAGMLGAEAAWTPAERDAAAGRRGGAVLRELAALQLALLGGGLDRACLSRLAILAEGEAGADPALREILEAISLRARVELARLVPSGPGQSREIASAPCTWRE